MKKTIKLYTLTGLAKHLGISYNYLRAQLSSLNKSGKDMEYRGFKFFGAANKGWYAYPDTMEILVEDAPELLPSSKASK